MDMDKYPDNLIDPEKNHTIKKGIVNLLIWLDVKINKYLLFGKTETISARMGRSIQSDHPSAIAVVLCDFLDAVQLDHCKKAYEAAQDRLAGRDTDFKG
jgi:hypothetical protein